MKTKCSYENELVTQQETQQKVQHLIQVHNILILSKLGIHCGKPSVYLILDFLLEVLMLNSREQHTCLQRLIFYI